MSLTRRIQKVGNSRGVILTSDMLAHLGVEDLVEVTFETGRLVLTAPPQDAKRRPGPRRQSKKEAMRATFDQYESALQQLADVPGADATASASRAHGAR